MNDPIQLPSLEPGEIPYWLNPQDDDDCYEPPDDFDFDCGYVPGHGCQIAGTEDCDFDCPYRDKWKLFSVLEERMMKGCKQ